MQTTVSIIIPTFQHARYIAQTIEGCIAQRTSFKFELLIGDDGSTDGTAEIIQHYAQRYPEQIRAFLHPKNLGPASPPEMGGKHNVAFLFQQATAPYIALCEGDDFWNDPEKLQKQVDILESQPDVALSFHNVEVFYEDGSPSHAFNPAPLSTYIQIEQLFTDAWFVPTCSAVFRNIFREGFPTWFHEMAGGDLGIFIMAASHGQLHYLPDTMAAYRRHYGGMSNLHHYKSRFYLENRLAFYQNLDSYFGLRYTDTLQKTIQKFKALLADTPL